MEGNMPIIKIKAISQNDICKISKTMVDDLQNATQIPREHFTLELPTSIYILDGLVVNGPPMVEVFWFDRGQELQDEVAEILTRHIQSAGFPDVDVIFTILDRNRYYENGEHF